MIEVEDLKPCSILPVSSDNLIAVGWLQKSVKFQPKPVSIDFFDKLSLLCIKPLQPFVSAGHHSCELCQFNPPRFFLNVFVPYQQKIYVAPVGILHYIAAHWYHPPEVFIDAVLACPTMNSMAYKKALLSNGGRELIRAALL